MKANILGYFERRAQCILLLFYGVLCAGIYAFFAYRFSLARYADDGRLYDLGQLVQYRPQGALGYAACMLALFWSYGQAWRIARQIDREKGQVGTALIVVLSAALIFALTLVWMYPINATDLFQYVFRSRILTVYGCDPFVEVPRQFPTDPYLYLVGEWVHISSPYGPGWELLASLAARWSGGRLLPNLLILKALAAAAYGVGVGLVYAILGRLQPARRLEGTLLFAWNPLILTEWIGNGHNDAIMICLILVGVWLWTRKQYVWLLPVLTGAVLIKAIAIVAIPFFLLGIWLAEPGLRRKLRVLAIGGAVSALVALLLFAPFWPPWQSMRGVFAEATQHFGFSFVSALVLIWRSWGIGLLGDSVTPQTIYTIDLALKTALRWLANGAIAAVALRQAWLVWKRERGPVGATAETFLAYVLLAPSFRMWYPAWPMALIVFCAPDWRVRRTVWLCFCAALSVLIYGYFREWSPLARHIPGILLTFVVPLLIGRWQQTRASLEGNHAS